MKRILNFLILIICSASLLGQLNLEKAFIEASHEITSLGYSNDGSFLASAGTDKNIFVWNTENGALINSLEGLNEIPLTLDFSPDGKYIVAEGDDNNIILWDIQTGKISGSLTGHTDKITSVDVDNEYIISGSKDNTLILWSLINGNAIDKLTDITSMITSVAFCPKESLAAMGNADGNIIIWDITSGKIDSLDADEGKIESISFNPAGNLFATGGADGIIKIWNIYDRTLVNSIFVHADKIEALEFSHDGNYIISGGRDKYVIITKTETGEIFFNSEEQSSPVKNLAFNPNGKEAVSSNFYSDIITIWNVSKLNINPAVAGIKDKQPEKTKPADTILHDKDHKTEKKIYSKENLKIDGHNIICSYYSYDGKLFATGGTDNFIYIRESKTGNITQQLTGLQNHPTKIRFSSNQRHIFSAGKDNNISVWSYNNGEKLKTLTGHTDEITSIAINNENTLLASASKDGSVKVWNIERGESILNLTGHNEGVTSVDFHPNGEMIVSGCKKGEIIVWNVKNGHLVNSFTADEESIRALKFSPNGNMFLSCGDSNIIRIWNSYNQVLQSSVLVHNKSVSSASFSPDGKYIISGGEDNFVIITDVISGEIIYHSEALTGSITSIAFNPNGMEFLASSYNSDILRRWDVSYLNIKPLVFADKAKKIDESLIPKIEWITEQNTESFSPATNIKFRVFSELHIDRLNVYNNNEINSIKANPEMQTGIWNEFEEKVYLKEDINEIIVELLFRTGRAVSEPLNINYKFDLDKLLATTTKFRKISVTLRESDFYEYTVRGAEGYSFQSEVIDVGKLENTAIDVQLVPLREETSIRLNNIHFATNSADLTSESFAELDRVVDLITTNPLLVLEISAHTCDLGTDAYNMLLSERRAESVVDYLIDNDVLADRLVPRGYGMHNPYVPNTSEENRALNRRVEFKVIEIRDKDVELEIEKDEENKEE